MGRLRKYLDTKSLSAYTGEDLYSTYHTLTYNLGLPGDTSSGLFARFENELALRFDPSEETVILFAIGLNDSRFYPKDNRHEVEIEDFKQNIWDMWEIARQYSKDVAFIGLTPVDEDRTSPVFWEQDAVFKNEYIERYNSAIWEFCQGREIPFIDVFDRMKDLNLHELMEDGLHPNPKGHEIIEEIVRTAIFENR